MYRTKMWAKRIVILSAAGFIMAGSAAGIESALASPAVNGPVMVSSEEPGPYFTGAINLCVNLKSLKVYAERTLIRGNCAAGWVQGTLITDPDALATPAASASASASASTSASASATATPTPTATGTEG